jgi:hypothetical protein
MSLVFWIRLPSPIVCEVMDAKDGDRKTPPHPSGSRIGGQAERPSLERNGGLPKKAAAVGWIAREKNR